MKNTILTFTTLIALLLMQINSFGQISKQQAIDIVLDSIAVDRLDSVNIYMDTTVLMDDYYIISPYDSIDAPYSNYWFFFIDEKPLYLWGHYCNYVFVNETNGAFTLVSKDLPPLYYKFLLEVVNTPLQLPNLTNDFSVPYNVTTIQENPHLYAVLFSGYGGNEERPFWNHLSHMYCALLEKGFPAANIFVLSGDGTVGSDPSQNHSNNLDNIGGDDIKNVPCSIAELSSIFQQLEQTLSDDDLLFVFATTHGTLGSGVGSSNLVLHEEQEMSDIVFASMLEDINCSQIIAPIYACHAGGMVDDLLIQTNNTKRMSFGPVEYYQGYLRLGPFIDAYGMDVFPYFLITAFRGYHPSDKLTPWYYDEAVGTFPAGGVPPLDNGDFNPDESGGNDDGVIQVGEVMEYTRVFDSAFNNFGVWGYDCGFIEDLLSPTGISGDVGTTQTIEGNFLIGGNLNIENGATLTVDNECKLYLFNGSISTEQGSSLVLQSETNGGSTTAASIHSFTDGGSVLISGTLSSGHKVKFSSEQNTLLYIGISSDVTFSDNEFEWVSMGTGTGTITINQASSFSNSQILGAGNYIIENSVFDQSSIDLFPAGPLGSTLVLSNSSFDKPYYEKYKIVSLFQVEKFIISGNTFSNYTDQFTKDETSLFLEMCGNYGTSNEHDIINNTFTVSDNQTYSNTNGISVYSSVADIELNNIQYQNTGLSLYGNSLVKVEGNEIAQVEAATQRFKNNAVYQVYASEYAFPEKFEYNVVYEDTYSGTYIFHDDAHINPVVDVECNYWGGDDPVDNLLPLTHYDYNPIWNLGSSCGTSQTSAALSYQTGTEQVADSNYNAAQTTFEQVVTDYPESQEATSSMKDLYQIETYVDSADYSSRQSWYLTEPEIVNNARLKKIGENLANKCDEELENYPDAIDWYEDMIEEPPTLQDSVFAIIDLENVYLEMGIDTTLRSAYIGRMPQYKPKSMQAHQQHRDELLALLGNVKNNSTGDLLQDSEKIEKPGELLQNSPNPFTGSTKISFHINAESDVQLTILSYTGQLIKTINMGLKTEGTHVLEFNATELNSGIYFYTLNINGIATDSKKMVILK